MEVHMQNQVVQLFQELGCKVYANAVDKGFYDGPRSEAEEIALAHSELSEWLEAIRHGNPESTKIPGFSAAEEEIADAIIRLLDSGFARGYRVGEAMIAKMAYNANREYKHGKQF